MDDKFKSKFDFHDIEPDVQAYIYQAISEFQEFATPDTIISVKAKDHPTVHRISISLKEDGVEVEQEATHENIYEAIRLSKQKLIDTLAEMQNSAISSVDRNQEIQGALAGRPTLH
jgi:ribosome-associated translation inhibitor RaiA